MSYIDKLRESAESVGNIVCMGLDPVMDVLPESDASVRERLNSYFSEIFHRMRLEGLAPAAFKPNIGYYAMLDKPRDEDFSGSLALADILDMLETFFPGIPVILDSKRGDIARSSGNYAILARTSNPGAKEFQNEVVLDRVDEKVMYPLYHAVALTIARWASEHPGLGAVVGATSPDELEDIASVFAGRDVPMLIPGVGSQGGSASEVIARMNKAGYDLKLSRINSSSGLTHPWKKGAAPDNWLDQVMDAVRKLTEEAAV